MSSQNQSFERVSNLAIFPISRANPFDPPLEFARIRDQDSLSRLQYPDGHTGWLATNYTVAKAILSDPRFSITTQRPPVRGPRPDPLADITDLEKGALSKQLAFTDPPEHTQRRRILAGKFTARRVKAHRPIIERIVSDQIDHMMALGPPVDFVENFALPVPSRTLCALLGVPENDRHQFENPMKVIGNPDAAPDQLSQSIRDFINYARSSISGKRRNPSNDILSVLASYDELGELELAGIAMQLFAAGHDTTASMLALGTYALLAHSQWETIVLDPEKIGPAVEELLRYLTIFQLGAFTRTASEDVEISGTLIRAGESITVALAAANRDPQVFESPDTLNVVRDGRRNLAFGHGIHKCLGQHLARLEIEISFRALIERLPTLNLALPSHRIPIHNEKMFIHGVEKLPVEWAL